MKWIKAFTQKKISILILILPLALQVSGCEADGEEDQIKECEIEQYGTVTIKNNTGESLWVDVTRSISSVNNEQRIQNGGYAFYERIDAGEIYIWASFTGQNYKYEKNNLDACENLTYTWKPNN